MTLILPQKQINPIEEHWKTLRHGVDMAYCIRKGLVIYPHPINSGIYIIKIEYASKIFNHEELVDNPFGDEQIYLPVEYKKNIRWKKDKCVWKQIMKLYKQYYIKFKTEEQNGHKN